MSFLLALKASSKEVLNKLIEGAKSNSEFREGFHLFNVPCQGFVLLRLSTPFAILVNQPLCVEPSHYADFMAFSSRPPPCPVRVVHVEKGIGKDHVFCENVDHVAEDIELALIAINQLLINQKAPHYKSDFEGFIAPVMEKAVSLGWVSPDLKLSPESIEGRNLADMITDWVGDNALLARAALPDALGWLVSTAVLGQKVDLPDFGKLEVIRDRVLTCALARTIELEQDSVDKHRLRLLMSDKTGPMVVLWDGDRLYGREYMRGLLIDDSVPKEASKPISDFDDYGLTDNALVLESNNDNEKTSYDVFYCRSSEDVQDYLNRLSKPAIFCIEPSDRCKVKKIFYGAGIEYMLAEPDNIKPLFKKARSMLNIDACN